MFKKLNKKIVIGIIVVIGIVIGVVYYKISSAASIKYIPDDFTSKEEHLEMVGIQDSIDFCIYQYDSSSSVENSEHFHVMDEEETVKVMGYFNNYMDWIDSSSIEEKCIDAMYAIDEGDYCLIYTKEGQAIGDGYYGEYDNYSVWYFDVETNKLYYIHANI